MFTRPVRANNRRHDVPAVLLSRLNQVASALDKVGFLKGRRSKQVICLWLPL